MNNNRARGYIDRELFFFLLFFIITGTRVAGEGGCIEIFRSSLFDCKSRCINSSCKMASLIVQ